MQDIVLRKVDYLDGSNFIYQNKIPSGMIYLRDIIEEGPPGQVGISGCPQGAPGIEGTPGKELDPELSQDEDKDFEPEDTKTEEHKPVSIVTTLHRWTAWQTLKDCLSDLPLVFSDMYRSPASSEAAYQRKNGIQRPGYSGHNYGVSVDMAIDEIIKRSGKHYPEIVEIMASHGWTPYQGVKADKNYLRGSEDWHFNFVGNHAHDPNRSTSSPAGSMQAESWIVDNFKFDSSPQFIQQALKDLKLYQGEVDGKIGPASNEAIKKFVAAWIPSKNNHPDHGTQIDELLIRTINIVHCNIVDPSGKKIF